MWLWLNKSDDPTNRKILDLENFIRGRDPSNSNKGVVLCRAIFEETPHFEQFQRIASSAITAFSGFYGHEQYVDNEDSFYLNHPHHTSSINQSFDRLSPDVITKWRMTTQVQLWDTPNSSPDGDSSRCGVLLHGGPMLLDVFSTGTVATTWRREHVKVDVRNDEGVVVGERLEQRMHKFETEFVDRVEFRLIVNQQLLGQWIIPGDSAYGPAQNEAIILSPFFNVTLVGGWFKANQYIIQTMPNLDAAFALVIAHLCATEFSIQAVKNDLHPATGDNPPISPWGAPQMSLQYAGAPFGSVLNF